MRLFLIALLGLAPAGMAAAQSIDARSHRLTTRPDVFRLDPEKGTLRFGDGLRGAKPSPNNSPGQRYKSGTGAGHRAGTKFVPRTVHQPCLRVSRGC